MVHPNSQEKTAFIDHSAFTYYFNRLSMGHCKSASHVQRAVTVILKSLRHRARVYFDDIIVMSKTYAEIVETLQLVLQICRARRASRI